MLLVVALLACQPETLPPAPPEGPFIPPAEAPASTGEPSTGEGAGSAADATASVDDVPELKSGTVEQLLAAGERYQKAGNLAVAAAAFRAALGRDPESATAHFGLARALAGFRERGAVCENDAWLGEVLGHVEQAVRRDAALRDLARSDALFAEARKTARWHVIEGADPSKPEDLARILTSVTFWENTGGVVGSAHTLAFAPDGTVLLAPTRAFVEVSGEAQPPQKGTWRVDGGVHVEVGARKSTWTLAPTGDLVEKGQIRWLNAPPECET